MAKQRIAKLIAGEADKLGVGKSLGDEYIDKVTKAAAKKPRKKRKKKSSSPAKALDMSDAASKKKSLDMSDAARLQRARDMGFDTDTVYYHGTDAKFDEFKLGQKGASAKIGRPGLSDNMVVMTTDKDHAAQYGDVGAYYLRGKIKDHDLVEDLDFFAKSEGFENAQSYLDAMDGDIYTTLGIDDQLRDLSKKYSSDGYDGVSLKYDKLRGDVQGDVVGIFDPSKIRSVNAVFDPAKKKSRKIMYSSGLLAPGLLAPGFTLKTKNK